MGPQSIANPTLRQLITQDWGGVDILRLRENSMHQHLSGWRALIRLLVGVYHRVYCELEHSLSSCSPNLREMEWRKKDSAHLKTVLLVQNLRIDDRCRRCNY